MANTAAQLKNSYPELLSHCYDFTPPKGWENIVASLFSDLTRILRDAQVPDGLFGIRQVKEKFGGLRVYVHGLPSAPHSPDFDRDWIVAPEFDSVPAPKSRNWHFEGICSLEFSERINDASIARILTAIGEVAYVPEAVATQIRSLIEAARQEADRTCQCCGANGALVIENAWHMTVCEEHRNPEARAAWRKEMEAQE